LPSEKYDGFSAAVDSAFSRGDTHFPEQIFGRQVEEGLHAWVLQGRQAEAALFKGGAETADQGGADGAIAIEEDPAAGGVPSFCISHF
jgi:hypothetical protein